MITDRDYRTQVDRVIREAGNASGGGVLLGRAAAVVLAEHPRALHVRLDGPIARRVQVVCQELGVDETKAADTVRINDAAREAYVKQLYGTDAKDPGHYNLVIDSTSIRHATCIELIVMAAQARNPEKPTAT
jgi:cytidylate kinase